MNCKRCGRKLVNAVSVERGYGAQCFRITQLNHMKEVDTPVNMSILDELLTRVRKLELDNTFMKHQLKHKTVSTGRSADADLEWRKASGQRPEQTTVIKVEMTIVIKELRVIFTEDFDYHDVLSPINGRVEAEVPPIDLQTIELYN